jgi:UDP-N-acetylmuramate dehydrogenase
MKRRYKIFIFAGTPTTPMRIEENFPLKNQNTFGIDVSARYFSEFHSVQSLQEHLQNKELKAYPLLIIGGGSNILFTKDFEGLVLKNKIKGIEIIAKDDDFVYIKSGAGEVWHDFVLYCTSNNFGGAENLSLIPGSVGAGPMQNIGAYGAELKDIFFELEALEIATGKLHTFNKEACCFGYRQSIFKSTLKNQYIIISVTFKLSRKPKFNIHYGAIEAELKSMKVETLNIQAISAAVCAIRKSKLPDPAVIGNAGSFFKNPEVKRLKFNDLKINYPEIVGYPTGPETVKIAAGWLIEQCGWKGKQIENYGVHKNQALVLVNYGGAKGDAIFQLSKTIREEVKKTFGVELEIEVNII